jgi:hypothetical protein
VRRDGKNSIVSTRSCWKSSHDSDVMAVGKDLYSLRIRVDFYNIVELDM